MRERYQQVLESQEGTGPVQVFYGRLSLKWGEAHEEELKLSRAKIAGRSSGLDWASSMEKAMRDHAFKECW